MFIEMFLMIFQSLMGLGKSRCDVLSGTTQGWACPCLVNGVKSIFKVSTSYCEKIIIWIMFQNSKIGTLTRKNIVIITTTLNQYGH